MTTTPLTERIAAAIGGHWPITPNNDGTVLCHCGDRVKADRQRQAFREHTAAAVLAVVQPELDRLAAANRQLDRDLGQAIDDRDNLHDMADRLAAAIAPMEVIGEHSAGNCPWENALDHASVQERARQAELDKLRAELADTARFRDHYSRVADHIAAKRDLAEAAIASWSDGEMSADAALLIVKKSLAVGAPAVSPSA